MQGGEGRTAQGTAGSCDSRERRRPQAVVRRSAESLPPALPPSRDNPVERGRLRPARATGGGQAVDGGLYGCAAAHHLCQELRKRPPIPYLLQPRTRSSPTSRTRLAAQLPVPVLPSACTAQGWQGHWGARGAGRQKAAPPAGARGAAKFRGR